MAEPKTIYDLGYFASKEAAERVLDRFSESTPLTLPDRGLLAETAKHLSLRAKKEGISDKDVLLAYQRLRESHEHTDVFCAWKVSSGSRCGGLMDVEVDAAGAFYLCRVDNNHRTPK
jgi:hypothetical protein